ncbi:MAG: multidrug ABC transporter substrate-binding protein [Sulfobacillus thermosulfidooxidans]|uniref:ABC transporter permease n=1 Tax=Sulfobacillus TaxID=28033 RepID=UPI000CD09D53|nr:ABC transporter permease [Sulfobacillus sp. hq2]MCY0909398.1 ABC transporter permease [Sulfobacillus thermotolerans]POB11835.1 multidrug ABC transporter substrate-binding protein [Sulfobacillus sp. hq2]PSR36649.1 MAG: multidrug ABC transporter substrate-binding protein [Sulfobacillus thermosulfidooxidans]
MPALEILRIALRSIRANKMRSLLTMLGIIIGVSAVILLTAVGRGATDMVTNKVESLGTNLIQIMSSSTSVGGINKGQGSAPTLTMADVQAIAQQDTAVKAVAPLLSTQGQVVWRANNYSTSIQGTTANYPQIENMPLGSGRNFTNQEVQDNATVAIIGTTVESDLFPSGMNPIGQTIDVNGIPFRVIGVLKSEGTNGFINQDDRIVIPITTDMNLLDGTTYLTGIYAAAKSPADMAMAEAEITSTLRVANQILPGQANNFTLLTSATFLSTLTSITGILTDLLAGVAGISLVVGGIGIMNIMLVSVTERTREIGIRKAIGASKGVILAQFVVEAVLVSIIGGLIGVAIGVLGAVIGGSVFHLSGLVGMNAVGLAFGFAALVGIVFGVYPARKAANLNPIDALRFE